jgi:hypothetical protein
MDSQSNSITIYIFIYQKLGKPTVLSPPKKTNLFTAEPVLDQAWGGKVPEVSSVKALGKAGSGCINEESEDV